MVLPTDMAQPVFSIIRANRPDAVNTKNIIVTRLPTPDGKVEKMDVASESAEPKAAINAAIRAAMPVCIPLKQRTMNTTMARIRNTAETATFVNKQKTSLLFLSFGTV